MKRVAGCCCLAFFAALFAGCCSHRCGPDHGCGRSYWGAYADDPPGCEPCDHCGNWTGGCQHCGRGQARFSRSGSMGTRMTSVGSRRGSMGSNMSALRSRAGSRMSACRCGRCRAGDIASGSGDCPCEQGETFHEPTQQPEQPMMHNVGYTTVRERGGFRSDCNCNH